MQQRGATKSQKSRKDYDIVTWHSRVEQFWIITTLLLVRARPHLRAMRHASKYARGSFTCFLYMNTATPRASSRLKLLVTCYICNFFYFLCSRCCLSIQFVAKGLDTSNFIHKWILYYFRPYQESTVFFLSFINSQCINLYASIVTVLLEENIVLCSLSIIINLTDHNWNHYPLFEHCGSRVKRGNVVYFSGQ